MTSNICDRNFCKKILVDLQTGTIILFTKVYCVSEDTYKLELCSFALKGEHNVYSLVPNIPVCIYIDQK